MNSETKRGFTLLELLIVIAIIAVLAVIIIIVLNPAETLKKARDVQRMSDLSTLKTALGLYITTIANPQLDNTSQSNTYCVGGTGQDTLYISYPTDHADGAISDTPPSGFGASSADWGDVTTVNSNNNGGTGWIPVNFTAMTGGSPISNLPIDPVNTVVTGTSTLAAVNNSALIYRYSCNTGASGSNRYTFEINAALESEAYTSTDDLRKKDGGNNLYLYEAGTNLSILPGTGDF